MRPYSCVFRGNRASGGAGLFEGNRANGPGGPGGGAIADPAAPSIVRCVLRDNRVEAHYFLATGGGADAGSGTVTDCLFAGNVAACWSCPGRAGVLAGSAITVVRCRFVGNAALQTDPPGPGAGGALFARFTSSVENCTLVANSGGAADGIGGIDLEEGGTIRASNRRRHAPRPHLHRRSDLDLLRCLRQRRGRRPVWHRRGRELRRRSRLLQPGSAVIR